MLDPHQTKNIDSFRFIFHDWTTLRPKQITLLNIIFAGQLGAPYNVVQNTWGPSSHFWILATQKHNNSEGKKHREDKHNGRAKLQLLQNSNFDSVYDKLASDWGWGASIKASNVVWKFIFSTVWTKKSCHAIPTACPVTQVYCQTCLWLIQNNFHKSWNFLFSQFSFLECLNSNKLVPNIQFPPTQTNSPATPETAQGNRIGNLAHDQVKKHCTRWSLQHQIAMVLHGLPITRINGPMVQRNIHGKLVVCGGWWFGIPVQGGGH